MNLHLYQLYNPSLSLTHCCSAFLSLSLSTTGKERVFLEVARVLRKKIYVNSAKLRILECLEFQKEDMQWFTLNEQESHIHVVPMWTLASFKRLKHISNHYAVRAAILFMSFVVK